MWVWKYLIFVTIDFDMLHKCNSYCLRKNPVATKDGDKVEWAFRFGYGDFNNETKISAGMEIHPLHPRVTKGEYPRYEGRPDHPRYLQHIKARLLSWKGNCDTQVITEQLCQCLSGNFYMWCMVKS